MTNSGKVGTCEWRILGKLYSHSNFIHEHGQINLPSIQEGSDKNVLFDNLITC